MKAFDVVQAAPSLPSARAKESHWESLQRRFKKRAQLEYYKLTSGDASFAHAVLTVFSGVMIVILSVVVFNGLINFGFSMAQAEVTLPAMPHQVSIIVPAFKERENISTLVERVFNATKTAELEAEIVIVDDNSQDGTVDTVLELQNRGFNVTLAVRKSARGLSSAVLRGIHFSQYDTIMCMDADLSHPPEQIGALVAPIHSGHADFTLGSRYIAGGGSDGWPLLRRITSFGATLLAAPLVRVRDPMSGFFAMKKDVINIGYKLNPKGFKIALEIMVKSNPQKIVEVPFVFVDRAKGNSKLSTKTKIIYVQQLLALYWFLYPITLITLVLLLLAASGFLYIAVTKRKVYTAMALPTRL
eukprot:CFRG6845T1